MKKIIVLSLALVAGLFMVSNVTKADETAQLNLEITGVPWYCQYGANLDLLSAPQSYSAFEMSGAFVTTSGADWFCNDTMWRPAWTMDISSNDLVTTWDNVYTISKEFIQVQTAVAEKYEGWSWFTFVDWDFTTWNNLSGTKVLFQKTSPAGTVWKLWVDTVDLRVLVPANQEIWEYQSTISIQFPNMAVQS